MSQRSMTDDVFAINMIRAQEDICSEELQGLSVYMSKAFNTIKREHLIQMIEEVFGPKSDIARMINIHLAEVNRIFFL